MIHDASEGLGFLLDGHMAAVSRRFQVAALLQHASLPCLQRSLLAKCCVCSWPFEAFLPFWCKKVGSFCSMQEFFWKLWLNCLRGLQAASIEQPAVGEARPCQKQLV